MTQQTDQYVRYVILLSMNEGKSLHEQLIREHVAYLRDLDEKGQLVLCGPFSNYRGGMVIIQASSWEEAAEIAERDPFVSSGAESFELRIWNLSCEDNNHLGMG